MSHPAPGTLCGRSASEVKATFFVKQPKFADCWPDFAGGGICFVDAYWIFSSKLLDA
jgi:hypothetical protein